MKTIMRIFCVLMLTASTAFAGTGKNIVETAMSDSQFSTLVSLVKEAGLVETLSSEGPFTLFAPTNAAFAKIPAKDLAALKNDKQKLAQVLKFHVVSGKVPASKVTSLSEAKTVEGSSLPISTKSGVMVGDASVTKTDIMTSNGVIHVIDTVLMPAS